MTITLPLPSGIAGPSRQTRTFGEVEEGYHVTESLGEVVRAVRAAKRIVVICGAGVSTAARIPDFRSAEGLFSAAKKGKTRSTRSGRAIAPMPIPAGWKKAPAVKDLFHVNSLMDDDLLPAHHTLLNSLYELSEDAVPTPFHSFLSNLDQNGQLLRCYTQNIDGLEEKAGLEVGLPRPQDRPSAKRQRRLVYPLTPDSASRSSSTMEDLPCTPPRRLLPGDLIAHSLPSTPQSPSSNPIAISNLYPRVIPLHGLLSTVKCTFCSHSVPFSQIHPLPAHHISCPACDDHSSTRAAKEQRIRSQGFLRPSVVLYGEEHPQGHLIGKVVERDLKGLGGKGEKEGKLDMLIVAGTSLSIPGVKRMVKEMSRALGERGGLRTIYVNDDAPSHPKEWDGVFNVWVKGDVQTFITDYLERPSFGVLPTTPPKTPRRRTSGGTTSDKKRKRIMNDRVSPLSSRSPSPSSRKCYALKAKRPSQVVPAIPARYWTFVAPTDIRSPSLTPLSDSDKEDQVNARQKEGIVSTLASPRRRGIDSTPIRLK